MVVTMSDEADTHYKSIDPRYLYRTEVPLERRVNAFSRYLIVDETTQSIFNHVSQLVADRSPILDIGCGVGTPLLPVGPTVFDRQDFIAVDLSLRQLKSILDVANNPSPRLLQVDAIQMPFSDSSFGAALARHMLYHIPNPQLAIAEAARVIRDDGIFIATTNSSHSRPELQAAHQKAVSELGGRLIERISQVFDAETGEHKLASSFHSVKTLNWSGVLAFSDISELLKYYNSSAYYKMAFDSAQTKKRLSNRVANILTDRFNSVQIPVTVRGAIFICNEPIRNP